MTTQQEINYNRIAEAIEFYKKNFKEQPSLDAVAEYIHVSPFHFQRMFREWAGVTPKQFLQYLTLEHAKEILKEGSNATLLDAAFESGLSGTGRLHDLFIKVEGMTPGEFKNGGKALAINYSFAESPFGNQKPVGFSLIEMQSQFLTGADLVLNQIASVDTDFFRAQKQDAHADHGNDDPRGAKNQQELAPLAVDQHHTHHGHEEINYRKNYVAPMSMEIG